MKILTRKQQEEILKMLATNHIIADKYMPAEGYGETLGNIYEVAYLIDGVEGMVAVQKTAERWHKVVRKNDGIFKRMGQN